jgi:DNA-directed RNA polymerase specialized sigma24 family protein
VLVLLRFEEGLAYPEIARMSGEEPATIQARVARALPSLRECVEQKGLAL